MKYVKIEKHLFETKNHKVKIEYHCYIDCFTYDIKTRLPESANISEINQVFHF